MTNDLARKRRAIEAAKSDLWSDSPALDAIDPIVRASWRRCAPDLSMADGAPVDSADDALERWQESPLRRAVPAMVDRIEQVVESGQLLACISDADGRLLWQSAPRWLRSKAERVGLLPGGMWHEGTSGTNGVGLALATDRPAAVFATEHWLGPVHDWVCYAAPIHDPDGAQIGALDLSTTWKHANPLALATVSSLAQLIEHELRVERSAVDLLQPVLELHILGEPSATLDGKPLRLTLRQLEILTILTVLGTATLGELHAHLYGDRPVGLGTLKAEMSRLRSLLGGRLASRPYRLTLPCRVDATRLLERLDAGDSEGAARIYTGQVLRSSEAPFVEEQRHHLDVALRTALLRHGTPAGALRYNAVHPYDTEVLERAHRLSSLDDPLAPALTARLAVALDD